MKKAIKILGVFLCAVVLFFNLSINGNSNAGDTNLAELLNKANAECKESTWGPEFNNGRCSFSENCFADPWAKECDVTQW